MLSRDPGEQLTSTFICIGMASKAKDVRLYLSAEAIESKGLGWSLSWIVGFGRMLSHPFFLGVGSHGTCSRPDVGLPIYWPLNRRAKAKV
jgi:hypothetical protein